MKRIRVFTNPLLLSFACSLLLFGFANAQTKPASRANITKTEQMLKQISANYRPLPQRGAFMVDYAGKNMKEIPLFVMEAEGGIAVIIDVATAKEVDLRPDLMRKLLEFTVSADFIKTGISKDGAIRVAAEVFLSSTDSKSLGTVLDQAAAGADEIAGIVAPFRKSEAGR